VMIVSVSYPVNGSGGQPTPSINNKISQKFALL